MSCGQNVQSKVSDAAAAKMPMQPDKKAQSHAEQFFADGEHTRPQPGLGTPYVSLSVRIERLEALNAELQHVNAKLRYDNRMLEEEVVNLRRDIDNRASDRWAASVEGLRLRVRTRDAQIENQGRTIRKYREENADLRKELTTTRNRSEARIQFLVAVLKSKSNAVAVESENRKLRNVIRGIAGDVVALQASVRGQLAAVEESV